MVNSLRITVLFMFWLALTLIATASCHASAKVQVDKAVYDAGALFEGKDFSHEFVLKNVGDQKFTFKPKPCWGATVTAPGGQEIEPGKTQKIVVSISTRYIKGDCTKNIEVETNDPSMSVLKLTMKAKIVEILTVTPMDFNFGTVKTGSINKKMFTITNKGKEPLTITSISANPSTVLSVSHQGKVKLDPDKSISVEVRFQAGLPTDFFFGTLHVETDQETVKAKDGRIRAKVVGN